MGIGQHRCGKEVSSGIDISSALQEALDSCANAREARSFECVADAGTPHTLQIRAVSLGPNDTVILVHDAGELRRDRDLLEVPAGTAGSAPAQYSLTTRQLTVLRLIALGATDKEVAIKLGISTFTASKHVANILSKMQVSCRTEASVMAFQSGLLQPA